MLQNTFIKKALKPLERFLKTDIEYLASGAFWTVGGRFLSMFLAFGLAFIYARYLTKEFYGSYTYVQSIISIALAFTLPGLGTTLLYAIARGNEGTFKNVVKKMFFISFLATLIAWTIALYFLTKNNVALALTLFIAGIIVPFYETSNRFVVYLNAKKQFKKRVLYNLVVRVISFIFIGTTVLWIYKTRVPLEIGLPVFVGVYFLSYAIPQIFFLKKIWRIIPKDSPTEKNVLKEGIHFTLMALPQTLTNYLDTIILFAFLNPAAVAVYSFATMPQKQLKGVLKSVFALVPPKVAKRSLEELQTTLPLKALKTSLIILPVVVAYIIAAPFIFKFFFPRYIDSVLYSQIFILALIVHPANLFDKSLTSAKKIKTLYIERLSSSILRLVLLIILTWFYGIMGTILAYVINSYISAIVLYILFKHPLKE